MNEEKIAKGKKIFEALKKDAELPRWSPRREYAWEILHAISPDTHDIPVDENELYEALSTAQEQGKKVYLVPKDNDGITVSKYDGWEYRIEIR